MTFIQLWKAQLKLIKILLCSLLLSTPVKAQWGEMTRHPLILGAVTLSSLYVFLYKGSTLTRHMILGSGPYGLMLVMKENLAKRAIEEDNPFLLNIAISLSSISESYFESLKLEKEFIEALIGGKKITLVLIERAKETSIDINKQHGKDFETPMGLALKEEYFEIVESLLKHNADLRQKANALKEQSLYYDLILSSQKNLAKLAIESGKKYGLENTYDEEGNLLLHHIAHNADLFLIMKELNISFSSEKYSTTNRYGKNPIHLAMLAYFNGDIDTKILDHFVKTPDKFFFKDNNLFAKIMNDEDLRTQEIPLLLVEKEAVEPAFKDVLGRSPLDLAIQKEDDNLAFQLAMKTESLELKQLGQSLLKGLTKTKAFLEHKLIRQEDDLLRFYLNPLGDGYSLLAYMVEDPSKFREEEFRKIYTFIKNNLAASNPLEFRTHSQGNLLEGAAISENRRAIECILKIIIEEGWMKHLSVLTSNSHMLLPTLVFKGYGDIFESSFLTLEASERSLAQNFLASGALQSAQLVLSEDPTALTVIDSETKSEDCLILKSSAHLNVLTVSPQFISDFREKEKRLHQMNKLTREEQKHIDELAHLSLRKEEEKGIPQDIEWSEKQSDRDSESYTDMSVLWNEYIAWHFIRLGLLGNPMGVKFTALSSLLFVGFDVLMYRALIAN